MLQSGEKGPGLPEGAQQWSLTHFSAHLGKASVSRSLILRVLIFQPDVAGIMQTTAGLCTEPPVMGSGMREHITASVQRTEVDQNSAHFTDQAIL